MTWVVYKKTSLVEVAVVLALEDKLGDSLRRLQSSELLSVD